MGAAEIDDCVADVPEPGRGTLEARLRQIASTQCPTNGSPDAVRATR
jgi:hypothetical protein